MTDNNGPRNALTLRTTSDAAMRLQGLAERARSLTADGSNAAQLIHTAEHMDRESVEAMERIARVDSETAEILRELGKAYEELDTNPIARRAWLTSAIGKAAASDDIDPQAVMALLFGGLAKRMPDNNNAIPLFRFLGGADARKWVGASLLLPRCWRDRGNTIIARGFNTFVAATLDDEEAMTHMISARNKAAIQLVEQMQEETLMNLRRLVWKGLWLLPDATIFTSEWMGEVLEKEDGGLWRTKRDPRRKYRHFELSPKENFVVQDTEVATAFVERLSLFAEEIDKIIDGKDTLKETVKGIRATLKKRAGHVISLPEFVRGRPGIVALRHNAWKVSRDSSQVTTIAMLLERTEKGAWRWVQCNTSGINSMFGGKNLRYHEPTKEEFPGHLLAFLRQADLLQTA